MSDWRDAAACQGLAPAFDLDRYDKKTDYEYQATDADVTYAVGVCAACPVKAACEKYMDDRLDAGEYLACVAAGSVYDSRRNKSGKTVAV